MNSKTRTPLLAVRASGTVFPDRTETKPGKLGIAPGTGRRAWISPNSSATVSGRPGEGSCVSHTGSMSLVDIRLDSVLQSSFGRRSCGRVGRYTMPEFEIAHDVD